MKAEKKLLPKGISRAERTEFLNHASGQWYQVSVLREQRL